MAMLRLADLPVSVELRGALGQELTRFVESEAGWQVVAPAGPPPPALVLTGRSQPGRPCVVVVPGRPTADDTREGLLAGALDVIGWPEGRTRLLDVPLRLAEPAPRGPAPCVLRVVGTAGGAGTSTVALALAGLCAWSGRRTVVVGQEDLLALCGGAGWSGPGAEALHALGTGGAAAEFPAVARPVLGLKGLRVLSGDGAAFPDPVGWPVEVVVADQRTAIPPPSTRPSLAAGGQPIGPVAASPAAPGDALVVVTRPDGTARLAAGLARTSAVLVVGQGPLDRLGIRRLLGRSEDAWLPPSARVARAGLLGRVPSSLPGSWVALLRHTLSATQRAA